jgi:hypothetical protein
VSLWQPRARIGATLVELGALCWNELATGDVAVREFVPRLPARLALRDRGERLHDDRQRCMW